MFTFAIFEILLFKSRLVLSPAQPGTGSERVKTAILTPLFLFFFSYFYPHFHPQFLHFHEANHHIVKDLDLINLNLC